MTALGIRIETSITFWLAGLTADVLFWIRRYLFGKNRATSPEV